MRTLERRTTDLAHQLETLAPQLAQALDHIAREIATADGHKTHTVGAPPPTITPSTRELDEDEITELTRTEADADRRWQLAATRAELYDNIEEIERLVRSITTKTRRASGERIRHDPGRCNGTHLDGYNIPQADGGWSDPTCTNPPRSNRGGLCDACRMRHTRWRQRTPTRNGRPLPELADERPITHDSGVYIDDLGVAHTTRRPA